MGYRAGIDREPVNKKQRPSFIDSWLSLNVTPNGTQAVSIVVIVRE